MKDNNSVNIYWAPFFATRESGSDWSILYSDPNTLFEEMILNKQNKGNENFFACPAVKNFMKNTYIFKNTAHSEYAFDFTDNKKNIEILYNGSLECIVDREPSIKSGPTIILNMAYIFFSEESTTATFSSPYFSPSQYMQYGSFIPGEFDIGQWFRPYICEIQLWNNKGVLKIEHNEPLFYVKFNTEKKINLHKFNLTDKLTNIVNTNIRTQHWYKTKNSLSSYYYLFNRSRMRDIVLKEIKKNTVSEEI